MPRVRLPIVPFLGSVVDEGKKVVWPNRDVVIRHTIMVIVSVAIATLIFASIDFGLQKLVILAIKK
ncbi:MAG: preprotein translocase subunit SecE [Candidatus Berkelbacteria bacterium]|nr:preprotein translocase subunit SecE [Candidatus Berkelbacteria bacterium]MCR4308317.1 preprotein translocase subunit SecE [Candidatus Berkelbacteria bacterium]